MVSALNGHNSGMDEQAPVDATTTSEMLTGSADSDAPVASRRGALAVLAGVVILLAVFFVVAFAPKGTPVGGVLPGDPTGYAMPDVTLERLDGSGPLTLSSLEGRPIVVNFWAAWCVTCKDEAAVMGAAERKWRSAGVVFIGMDSKDDDAAAKAFEAEYGMEYTSLVDRTAAQTPRWGVTGYPETFFIGRDGRIVSKYISAIDAATLDARIAEIVAP